MSWVTNVENIKSKKCLMQVFFSLSNESCFLLVTLVLSTSFQILAESFPNLSKNTDKKVKEKLFGLFPNANENIYFLVECISISCSKAVLKIEPNLMSSVTP